MMENFVNKWFPPQKPNLAAKYDKDFIPPAYAYKKSMDRLKEIDRKLDLLHEYLAYRIDWMSKYGPVATMHLLKNTGIWLIHHEDLKSFEEFVLGVNKPNIPFIDTYALKQKIEQIMNTQW